MNEKITASTISRTIVLLMALINQVLVVYDKSVLPIQDAEVEQLVTLGFTITTAVVAWWHNNSFTKLAISADNVITQAKSTTATTDVITSTTTSTITSTTTDTITDAKSEQDVLITSNDTTSK